MAKAQKTADRHHREGDPAGYPVDDEAANGTELVVVAFINGGTFHPIGGDKPACLFRCMRRDRWSIGGHEAEMFVGGARSISAGCQRWINNPDQELVANRKPYQLEVARRVGLAIPRTLMSNDPARIKTFFDEARGEVVLKPFHAIQWLSEEAHYVLFAKKLRFEDIDNPDALRLTSHIFQDYLEKRYELRVFYLGGRLLAFKLHTQENEATRTDWRISTDGSLRPEPYATLPEPVCASIRRYMNMMGLEYGAFDFIVDEAGRYVFLECNVSGQFLFIEEWNPEIRMLAEFIRFMTSTLDLTERQRALIDELRYLDFYHSAETGAHYGAISASYPCRSISRNLHRESSRA